MKVDAADSCWLIDHCGDPVHQTMDEYYLALKEGDDYIPICRIEQLSKRSPRGSTTRLSLNSISLNRLETCLKLGYTTAKVTLRSQGTAICKIPATARARAYVAALTFCNFQCWGQYIALHFWSRAFQNMDIWPLVSPITNPQNLLRNAVAQQASKPPKPGFQRPSNDYRWYWISVTSLPSSYVLFSV